MTIKLFLFDLDGTVVDTAPDLIRAANLVRTVRNLPALPDEVMRPLASQGAPGLIGVPFSITKEHPDFPALRAEFFENYERELVKDSKPFEGIVEMLHELRAMNIKTGIITNKLEYLTIPIMEKLDLAQQFDVILGSDSKGCKMKPEPDAFYEASRRLGIPLTDALYAGDDPRDVNSAHIAGVPCAAARWGYLKSNPDTWNADFIADTPADLLKWVSQFR